MLTDSMVFFWKASLNANQKCLQVVKKPKMELQAVKESQPQQWGSEAAWSGDQCGQQWGRE